MSTKRALFALSLALFVVLPTFGSRNEILRADDGEEDNPDCEFTEAMFNAIREKLSCPTVCKVLLPMIPMILNFQFVFDSIWCRIFVFLVRICNWRLKKNSGIFNSGFRGSLRKFRMS